MRSLPMFMRLAEDMRRLAFSSSMFYEDPWRVYRIVSPSAQLRHMQCEVGVVPTIGKDGYQVSIDVANFKPSELTVKVVDNNVVVEGKHKEREDESGYISRQFVRRYALPKDYDPAKVMSSLSADGVLTVHVPNPAIEKKSSERQIPIQQTGSAHPNMETNSKEAK